MILVTGANGNVGSEVVKELIKRNIEFRSGVSNPVNSNPHVNPVKFDFEDPSTFNVALKNIDKIFLIRPPHISNVKKIFTPFLEEAKNKGIKHIVFLSVEGVDENKAIPHHKIELEIIRLNFNYTFLRAGFFMQNMNTTHKNEIKYQNKISLPVGNSKTAFIDTRDIGLAASICLLDSSHINKKYTLTGKESLNYNEVAQVLTKVLKRKINFNDVSYFSFFLKIINFQNQYFIV